jgi:hypothetical protein
MPKKILTLDNLYQFFVEQNKTVNFSAKEAGVPIVVTTPGFFAESESYMPGMLGLKLKVCHTKTNLNGSHISEANMQKAMPTLKYRPILAHIHELKDGTKDFYAHNMEIVENEDGEAEINYIEKQVGCFTADEPWLEYDKERDKDYVMAYAVIPEGYTDAADIIRRKNGTKVSCELVINELAYNAKEKYLDLTDFYFGGCTLLGVDEEGNEIGEGMLGSRADISDFCHKEPTFNYQDKLIETLEKLNFTLESLNKEKNVEDKGGEGDMDKLNELLAKYCKTVEEIPFAVEGLSDEELEAKFEEEFENADEGVVSEETNTDPSVSDEGEGEGAEAEEVVEDTVEETTDVVEEEPEVEPSEESKFSKSFAVELSHDDIRCALYNLIAQYEEEDNDYYYIREVYDNYFYMQGWATGKIYKLGYGTEGENVSLEGERQEVFELIITESEKIAIEKMREDYSALEAQYDELKAFKEEYEARELKAQKDAIFEKPEYECLSENEDFNKLVEESDNYSVEEISTKADLIFAAHVKNTGSFAARAEEKKTKVIGFNFTKKESKKSPYGNLFSDK